MNNNTKARRLRERGQTHQARLSKVPKVGASGPKIAERLYPNGRNE